MTLENSSLASLDSAAMSRKTRKVWADRWAGPESAELDAD
jgi:hypothetical protein